LAESGKTTEEPREYAAAGIRVGHKPDGACNAVGEGAIGRPLEIAIDPDRGEQGSGAKPNEANRRANEGKGNTKHSDGKNSVLPPGNRDRYDQSEGCQECDGAGAAGGSRQSRSSSATNHVGPL